MKYTRPNKQTSALITIDVQQDFVLPGAPAEIPGTYERIGQMKRLLAQFREAEYPIIHVIRLYLSDGSNVDACRREFVENGNRFVTPDTTGAELVQELKPYEDVELDSELLLFGSFQSLGASEWIMYKPRWDAFYGTNLEKHLHNIGVENNPSQHRLASYAQATYWIETR